ncbi:hypothetical protein K7X08_025626 [Anisodus acutangulus]|uniref:RING-type domain-containing protein n=1 Tax=Anisodus acutangulus TaxID=402998 RepID=A0A9Q1R5Z8_9SOLA|nr:hypothetical protein K7X08_025626 [Anisodus acutangulus]
MICSVSQCSANVVQGELNLENVIGCTLKVNMESVTCQVNNALQYESKLLKNECLEKCLFNGGSIALFGVGSVIKHLELDKRWLTVDIFHSNVNAIADKELLMFLEKATSGSICTEGPGVECKLERNNNGSYIVKISATATKVVAEMRKPLDELMNGKIVDHVDITPTTFGPDLSALKEKVPGAEFSLNTKRHCICIDGTKDMKLKVDIISEIAQRSFPTQTTGDKADCPVCLGEMEDPYRLEACRHVFCRSCLLKQCESAIKSQEGFPLCCIHQGCGEPILLADLKSAIVE